MNQFSAEQFYHIARSMEELKCRFKSVTELRPGVAESFSDYFNKIGSDCAEIGLEQSSRAAARTVSELGRPPESDHSNTVRHHLKALSDLISSEMSSQLFLWIPVSRARFYDESAEGIAEKFPSSEYDIKEAAKSLACARWTASVMHSMRVLEYGLDALGESLRVKRGSRGWGQDLNNFENKWTQIEKAWKKGHPKLGWRRAFYPSVFSQFRYFENAWRNHAMHAHARYDEEEAAIVFEHVRAFMRILSGHLREPIKKRLKSVP